MLHVKRSEDKKNWKNNVSFHTDETIKIERFIYILRILYKIEYAVYFKTI